jgi:spermidine synthase
MTLIFHLCVSAPMSGEIQTCTRNVWFTDKDENQAVSLRYTGEVLHDVQTDFQRVRILESPKYGKLLALDDMFMTTENDEFHYAHQFSLILTVTP